MTVFLASLTVYVPKLATSPLMTALYSSAVPWSILLAPNLGRSERVMNCAKLPFPSNMKMPFGLEPQRSLLVPSAFTSSAETKIQVPTICLFSVFPFCCARAVPATPASIAPISIVSANLRCAFMAVLPRFAAALSRGRSRKADKNPAEAGSVSLLKRMRRRFLYEAALYIFAHHGHQLMASWGCARVIQTFPRDLQGFHRDRASIRIRKCGFPR